MATAWVRSLSCRSYGVADAVVVPSPTPSKKAQAQPLLPAVSCGTAAADVRDSVASSRPALKQHQKPRRERRRGGQERERQHDARPRPKKKPKQMVAAFMPSPAAAAPASSAFLTMAELPEGHSSRQVVELIFSSGWDPAAPEVEAMFCGVGIIVVYKLNVLRSECAMIGKPKLYETKSLGEVQEPNLPTNAAAPRVEQIDNNLSYGGPYNGVHGTVSSSIGQTIEHGPNNVLSGGSYGTMSTKNTMHTNVVQPNSQRPLLVDLNVLERMLLNVDAEPMNLTLPLLEYITNGFSPDHEIGSGGFAVVYKGTVGNLRVAVKKLTRTHELPESKFHKEVECLMKARHRNIVRFLGYCAETQGKVENCEGRFVMADMRNWLLCFEYVPNGSLEKYITDASSGLGWRQRFGIIKGICHGLHYLHKKHILHLDLKPANILLDDHMEPKIADFGLSRCLGEEQTCATTKHVSGTLGYMAPEFFNGKVAFVSDIYSLGVIIMEILTGAKGYPEDENVTGSWMNRLEGDMQIEQVRVCTQIGIKCIESDPKKRPVARHIINMLDKTASANETGTTNSLV